MKNKYDLLNNVQMDFDAYEPCTLNSKELEAMKQNATKAMKKKPRIKKYLTLAACIALVAALSQTTFAQELVENIIKSISTGHNRFTQVQTPDTAPVPEELQGKIFDKDGNPLTFYTNGQEIYDENHSKIISTDQIMITPADSDDGLESKKFYVNTPDDIQQHASFDVKLPSYLPEGYTFENAYFFKEDDGSVSGDYLFVHYKNADGKKIIIDERIINDETAFEAGTDGSIEETKINGHKAVIMDGKSVDWEADGASYGVNGPDKQEAVKIAESMK